MKLNIPKSNSEENLIMFSKRSSNSEKNQIDLIEISRRDKSNEDYSN